jgi:thiol:disulfide interchange protein
MHSATMMAAFSLAVVGVFAVALTNRLYTRFQPLRNAQKGRESARRQQLASTGSVKGFRV